MTLSSTHSGNAHLSLSLSLSLSRAMSCCFSRLPAEEPLVTQSPPSSSGRQSTAMQDPKGDGSWSVTRPRIFDLLAPARNVLIAGCGGGYDVLSGLPLYFALRREGKNVFLASLSFTHLPGVTSSTFCEMCVRVTHDIKLKTSSHSGYFPEHYLTQWLRDRFGENVPVYAFYRETGVAQLSNAYSKIISEHRIDAIVLVDGGTDSLMFGFEEHMGTPTEDQSSIVAVSSLKEVPVKLLACIGFGVDTFHGVSHGLFLENVATMEKEGGYYGCFSVPQHSTEGQLYIEGYKAVAKCMQPSIVCASVTDAMQGHFGNHHSTQRTGNSKLFINPLMPIYWTFDLPKLAAQIPYREKLLSTKNAFEVTRVIGQHHGEAAKEGKLKKPVLLPM